MPKFLDGLSNRVPALARRQFDKAVAREVESLDRSIKDRPTAAEPAIVALDQRQAVWKVTVPGQQDRFMSLGSTAGDPKRYVVHVDADKLYRAWLNRAAAVDDPRRQDHCVLRADMPRDYKFADAEQGFAHGRSNPVPLAECSAGHDANGRPYVAFNNGVTRSMWLLANKAEAFPVLVRGEAAAQVLHEVAGIGPAPVKVSNLFEPPQVKRAPAAPPIATAKPSKLDAIAAWRKGPTPPRSRGR